MDAGKIADKLAAAGVNAASVALNPAIASGFILTRGPVTVRIDLAADTPENRAAAVEAIKGIDLREKQPRPAADILHELETAQKDADRWAAIQRTLALAAIRHNPNVLAELGIEGEE